ncbi:MAG: ROK family transcriptional regulator [Oscillospiraceae bacterium]|nr:ROK family transcriptional regulator [Oscillospiraceae bacterium]
MKIYLTQENLKQNSISDILEYVMAGGGATRREIQRETGFSWGTVSENAAELISRGYLLEEKDVSKGKAGRTGYILKLNGEQIVSIGIDINKIGMSAVVMSFDREIRHRIFREFTAQNKDEVIESALSLCDEALEFCKDKYKVLSIGLAVQGSVDNKNGVSLRFPIKSGWSAVNFKELFEQKYGVFTYVDHDPKCMLLAKAFDLKKEEGNAPKNLMLIRVDKGIGMSVMLDSRICEDVDKMELAHTLAVYNGLKCSCGRKGCLEAYSSISGISARCGVSFEKVLKNRERYVTILEEGARLLAVALHNAAMLFYPDKIILTGDYINRDDSFLETLKKYFYEFDYIDGRKKIEICADKNISAAFGAALKSQTEAVKNLQI